MATTQRPTNRPRVTAISGGKRKPESHLLPVPPVPTDPMKSRPPIHMKLLVALSSLEMVAIEAGVVDLVGLKATQNEYVEARWRRQAAIDDNRIREFVFSYPHRRGTADSILETLQAARKLIAPGDGKTTFAQWNAEGAICRTARLPIVAYGAICALHVSVGLIGETWHWLLSRERTTNEVLRVLDAAIKDEANAQKAAVRSMRRAG